MTAALDPCTRCGATVEAGDLRCAVCALVLVAPPEAERTRVLVARCAWCHAALAYDQTAGPPRCGFCGSATEVEALDDPVDPAGWYLRASVDLRQARRALSSWLGSLGWLRPGDLRATSTIDQVQLVWWPAWVFDARATVSWSGDSEINSRRADWAPYAGQTEMTFRDIAVPASRALRGDETAALLPTYDFADGAADPPETGPGGEDNMSATTAATAATAPTVIERFEVQRSTARERVLDAARAAAGARVSAELLPGRRRRNLHLDLVLRDLHTRRVAVPAYVLAYRYRGKLYRAVVSGHDARRVIGRAPWSAARIAVAAATLLAALAALAWWLLA